MTSDRKPRRNREFIRCETFVFDDGTIEYKVFRDRRARTIRLKWFLGDGLTMTVPWKKVPHSTESILRQKTDWLNHCRARETALRNRSGLNALASGDETLYMGRRIPVHLFVSNCKQPRIRLLDDSLRIEKHPEDRRDRSDLVAEWLRTQSRLVLIPLVDSLASRFHIDIKHLSLRSQKKRWGSWSSRKSINLNWRLVMLPPSVIEYVIIHELMHDRHPDHSKQFWNAVETHCPGWSASRSCLKDHAFLLVCFRHDATGGSGRKKRGGME